MRYETTDTTIERSGKELFGAFKSLTNIALPCAFIGGLGLLIGLFTNRPSFWASYTFAFAFWMNLSIGFTTLTYLHHAIRATWSLSILRVVEAGNRTMWVMGAFWLPLMLGVAFHQIYQWTNPDIVAHSAILQHKQIFLNPAGWIVRGFLYFAYWLITLGMLNRSSLLQDETLDEGLAITRYTQGAWMGVVSILLVTLAITDWFMSLDPIYYSTIYCVIYMMAGVLAATAIGAIVLTTSWTRLPFSQIVTPTLTKNVGNMCLGFTMFWAYTSLAQFLIQWSANLPEEISFYAVRFEPPLVFVGAAVVIGQFFVPFLCLLSGRTKRTYDVLRKVAFFIVFMRIIDCWWQITPFFRRTTTPGDILLDAAAWAAIGGIWVAFFLYNMKKYPLLVTYDPRLIEAKANAHA